MFHIDRNYKELSRDYVCIYKHDLVEIKEENQPHLKEIESLFESKYHYMNTFHQC